MARQKNKDGSRFYHGITFEIDSDRTEHERSVYRLIDLMGDVGGFLGILQVLGQFLIYFLSGDSLTHFLISRLFEKRD